MAAADTAVARPHSVSGFVAAWLGWAFDGLDSFLYPLIGLVFVKQLMPAGTSQPEVAKIAALVQAIFLVGWAAGGFVFGRVGDAIGRAKTLSITIATYAIFTGLAFFVQNWWELAIVRFIAALGIGGEWAAGSALVAETLNPRFRPWASATLQSGYMAGMIVAAVTVGALGAYDPRYVWLVGVLPAFVTIWIRRHVPEPPEWEGERQREKMPSVGDLFRFPVVKTTLFILSLCSLALTSVWAMLYFYSPILRGLTEVKSLPAADQAALLRNVTIIVALACVGGNYVAAALARWAGYRVAVIAMLLGGLITFVAGFGHTRPLGETELWLYLASGTALSLFALFPLYLPPMFPTLIRTTGAGFCYNAGRLVAAIGTVVLGFSTAAKVSPSQAIYYAGMLYVPMIVLALFMPVLKEEH